MYYFIPNAFRLGPIVKGFFEIIFLFYALLYLTKSKIHLLFSIILFILFFLTGQYFLTLSGLHIHFWENFNSLFKYLFPIILFLPAKDIIDCKKGTEKIWKVYKWVLIINSIFIIVGLIFSIEFFRTYKGPWRFGYNGLIFAQNESSYIFIFAITTLYYRRFYKNIKEKLFWLILASSFLVGTKAVYLYLVLLLIFHFLQRVSFKKFISTVLLLGISGYLVFFSLINKIILNAWEVFNYSYQKFGLLAAILSGRNFFIQQKLIPLVSTKWSFINFIIGGHDMKTYYIEMGLIDLFLFFGLLGGLLYLYIFFKMLNFVQFEYKFKLFFTLSLLGIIALSGHFFESGIATIHFIFFILVNQYQKTGETDEHKYQ